MCILSVTIDETGSTFNSMDVAIKFYDKGQFMISIFGNILFFRPLEGTASIDNDSSIFHRVGNI